MRVCVVCVARPTKHALKHALKSKPCTHEDEIADEEHWSKRERVEIVRESLSLSLSLSLAHSERGACQTRLDSKQAWCVLGAHSALFSPSRLAPDGYAGQTLTGATNELMANHGAYYIVDTDIMAARPKRDLGCDWLAPASWMIQQLVPCQSPRSRGGGEVGKRGGVERVSRFPTASCYAFIGRRGRWACLGTGLVDVTGQWF